MYSKYYSNKPMAGISITLHRSFKSGLSKKKTSRNRPLYYGAMKQLGLQLRRKNDKEEAEVMSPGRSGTIQQMIGHRHLLSMIDERLADWWTTETTLVSLLTPTVVA